MNPRMPTHSRHQFCALRPVTLSERAGVFPINENLQTRCPKDATSISGGRSQILTEYSPSYLARGAELGGGVSFSTA